MPADAKTQSPTGFPITYVYFIGPDGTERYVAAPMADRTSNGTAYLPASQIAAWGNGIALVARTLTS